MARIQINNDNKQNFKIKTSQKMQIEWIRKTILCKRAIKKQEKLILKIIKLEKNKIIKMKWKLEKQADVV